VGSITANKLADVIAVPGDRCVISPRWNGSVL
jgi:hypothetical protein